MNANFFLKYCYNIYKVFLYGHVFKIDGGGYFLPLVHTDEGMVAGYAVYRLDNVDIPAIGGFVHEGFILLDGTPASVLSEALFTLKNLATKSVDDETLSDLRSMYFQYWIWERRR